MKYKKLKLKQAVGLLLVVLTACFLSSCTQTTRPKRILFIGNSYTYRNNMPLLFEQIAKSKGENVEVSYITRGKYTFYLQAKRKIIRRALTRKSWDVIVLQGSSMDMLRDSIRFKRRTYPAINQLKKIIEKQQKNAQVYFYMTWPYGKSTDVKTNEYNPDSMLLAVDKGYQNLKHKFQIPVIPVGKIWRAYMLKFPESKLYTQDNAHPSFTGSYLVACTMYQSIFGKNALGAPNLILGKEKESKQIQRFVSEAFKRKQITNYLKPA